MILKNTRPISALAATTALRFQPFDLLATLVAVVHSQGEVLFANAALEDALGISRRAIVGSRFSANFTEPSQLDNALLGAGGNEFAALRYEAWLRRFNRDPLPVHVIVTLTESDAVIVEMVPLEQQTRQDREERLFEQAQANKELIRNLAHEIKNPLGGIRGAAQLLEMDIESPELIEYTQGRPPPNPGGPLAGPAPASAFGGRCQYS